MGKKKVTIIDKIENTLYCGFIGLVAFTVALALLTVCGILFETITGIKVLRG